MRGGGNGCNVSDGIDAQDGTHELAAELREPLLVLSAVSALGGDAFTSARLLC